MDMNLYGKVALVSGCSQGLGYHAALALAKQGADIFGGDGHRVLPFPVFGKSIV